MRSLADFPKIFLARHGQSTLNLQQRISGQADCSLSKKGREQALALSDVLRREPLTAIYASSLQRALQTAAPTAKSHGLTISALDDLREMRFGILEGRYMDQRDAEAQSLWLARKRDKYGFSVPGGETFPDFQSRVWLCFESLLATSSGSILIVGHRNTNEVILARLLARDLASRTEINVKNKYLYAIRCDRDAQIDTIRLGGEHHGRRYPGLVT